jgi:hypothetical protein
VARIHYLGYIDLSPRNDVIIVIQDYVAGPEPPKNYNQSRLGSEINEYFDDLEPRNLAKTKRGLIVFDAILKTAARCHADPSSPYTLDFQRAWCGYHGDECGCNWKEFAKNTYLGFGRIPDDWELPRFLMDHSIRIDPVGKSRIVKHIERVRHEGAMNGTDPIRKAAL